MFSTKKNSLAGELMEEKGMNSTNGLNSAD